MTNWRTTQPDLDVARARLADFERQTAHLTLAECNAELRRLQPGAILFTCGGDGKMTLDDLRSLIAELLYLESEERK